MGNPKIKRKNLCKKQGGKCIICGMPFSDDMKPHYHYIVSKKDGGRANMTNGCAICDNCHDHLHENKESEQIYNNLIRVRKISYNIVTK